jgi:hypothetical protein
MIIPRSITLSEEAKWCCSITISAFSLGILLQRRTFPYPVFGDPEVMLLLEVQEKILIFLYILQCLE